MVHILVIDDEPQIRQLLRKGLEDKGHRVDEAADGRRGLTAYKNGEFDLVITDVLMPEMDGIELLRELRDQSPDCRLLAISGGSNRVGGQLLGMMKTFGACQTLAKPFTLKELNTVVDELLAT